MFGTQSLSVRILFVALIVSDAAAIRPPFVIQPIPLRCRNSSSLVLRNPTTLHVADGNGEDDVSQRALCIRGGAGKGSNGADSSNEAKGGGDKEPVTEMKEEVTNNFSFAATAENMTEVMEELGKMPPDELQAQLIEGLRQLTGEGIMDSVLEKKDEVLETMAAQGLVPPEKIAEYRANPEKVRIYQKSVRDTRTSH